MKIIDDFELKSSEIGLRLASTRSYIENYLKKDRGLMEGYRRLDMLTVKRKTETNLKEFIDSKAEFSEKYGDLFTQLDSLYADKSKTREKDFMLRWLIWGCDLLNVSCKLHKWAIEREKPDIDRKPRYQDRDTARAIESLKNFQINFVPEADKETLKLLIKMALSLPEDQRIEAIDNLFGGQPQEDQNQLIDRIIDDLYAATETDDTESRLRMFHMTREDIEKLEDKFIRLAVSIRPELDDMDRRNKEFMGAETVLRPLIIQAYMDWKPRQLYPDANGTMRLNFGNVKGYSPRDAVFYSYITSLEGLMEKETGENPFIVPGPLKQAFAGGDFEDYIDATINDVPVNFTTTNCGTNGNSGSPVLNGRGEIVGLDFDGNYESVADDYMYNPALSRSINCDIRYILYLIDKVYHHESLLNELTIH